MIPEGKIPFSDLSTALLSSEHNIRSFKCKNELYTRFLKRDAIEALDECVTSTHLVYYKKEVLVGFFSLVNDIIQGDQIKDGDTKPGYRYETYPAMKIARLATHKDWEGKGIGPFMLMSSIAFAIRQNQISACRFITVDAINDRVSFYIKYGFVVIEEEVGEKTTLMYLNYSAILKMIQRRDEQKTL
jgi:predicted GNAT family N-acyltransferase